MSDPRLGLLTLVRWLSPAFPLGSFAYSHGLETAMASGLVRTGADVRGWVGDVIARGSGRADAILLAHALRPGADHDGLSDLAAALAASRERLAETMEQGTAFVETLNGIEGRADKPAALPVAVGRAASGLGVDGAEVVALYLNAFATALVLSAVRFLPLGQTEGQAILAALDPVIRETARAALETPLKAIGGAAFGSDMASMAHEELDVRIFRT